MGVFTRIEKRRWDLGFDFCSVAVAAAHQAQGEFGCSLISNVQPATCSLLDEALTHGFGDGF
jgi:hypothetical protein